MIFHPMKQLTSYIQKPLNIFNYILKCEKYHFLFYKQQKIYMSVLFCSILKASIPGRRLCPIYDHRHNLLEPLPYLVVNP